MPCRSPIFIILLAVGLPGSLAAALGVTDIPGGSSAAAMVAQLLGPGVSVSNIVFTGAPASAGTFSGGTGILGFDSGIVLSSGKVSDVVGLNDGTNRSSSFGTPGDADLDSIAGVSTEDASVLEFDFVPTNAVLTFTFVFGSEEYPEFVGSFNDGFGLLVNGINVAKLPVSGIPVTINNVNSGANTAYYYDNTSGSAMTVGTQLDGFTVPITVTVAVNVGVTNHMKIAIADALDTSVDSAVFVQAGSFSAPSPTSTQTPVYTPTQTPTITLTPTITPTFSVSPSFSFSPTFSDSPTITLTATPTSTLTQTLSSTITQSYTSTPSFTASPTFSITLTPSMTFTVTPTLTPTPLPLQLKLLPPSPNPSNGADGTFIPYFLSVDADVFIDVWTVAGERARHLHPGWRLAGYREDFWDQRNEAGTKVASGTFIYRVRAVSAANEEKMDFKKCAVTR